MSDELMIQAAAMLSEVFIAPPGEALITAKAKPAAREDLRNLGLALLASPAADQLCKILTDTPSEQLTADLQRSYTRLFEGVFPRETVSPYESHWQASGESAVRSMNAALRALDIRVSEKCAEPVDHISIQLSTYAAALLDGRRDIAADVARNLSVWVPAFFTAVISRDQSQFYAQHAELLSAFVTAAREYSPDSTILTSPKIQQREGEDA
ncbi:TorD/DmsD family molecular chaperone [Ruegeria jejuensis]|uniref:TorD/DmsD family molecular chaperone n=1 Tax=Ruegeria jejuensis TaxID=3233338 RepID=UPI00355C45E5